MTTWTDFALTNSALLNRLPEESVKSWIGFALLVAFTVYLYVDYQAEKARNFEVQKGPERAIPPWRDVILAFVLLAGIIGMRATTCLEL